MRRLRLNRNPLLPSALVFVAVFWDCSLGLFRKAVRICCDVILRCQVLIVYTTQGEELEVHNPSGLPAVTLIDRIDEPYIRAQVISKSEFFGAIMKLCLDKRGVLLNQHFLTSDRVELTFKMPLSEIVFDFYDKLKSISRGYASFDYHLTGYEQQT